MKLLTIILNYRTPEMTLDAAEAALAEIAHIDGSSGTAKLVIVDNDSRDGSYDRLTDAAIRRRWGDRASVIASGHNGGFGAGNNFAIRRNLASADPADYFYLLNSDAFPQPGAITTLLDFLENHRYVGIAGSYIQGTDGEPHHTAFRYPTLLGDLEAGLGLGVASKLLSDWIVALPIPARTRQVEWLAGASMMIRRDVLDKVGLFDETFFLYFEETDLCRRATLAGFPVYYVRESVVNHIGSASTGMKDRSRPMPRFWFDSRKHYFAKHHGRVYLRAANLAWTAGHLLWTARKYLQQKEDPHPPHLLRDFVRHNLWPGLGSSKRNGVE